MSVYEERSLLFSRHRQRSTTWDEDDVIVTVGPHTKGDKFSKHEVDKSPLLKAVANLSEKMRPGGEYVEATREVAKSVTSAVDELEAVSSEPEVKGIWQIEYACKDTQAAVDTAYKYIDKIDDIPWYACSKEMKGLAEKTTTYSSIRSNLKAFKSIIEKMQKSLVAAEEYYRELEAECEQAARSCKEAEATCCRKAKEQPSLKKKTQFFGTLYAAADFGTVIIVGGVATAAIGVLTLGIGAPIAAGVTAAVAARKFVTAAKATFVRMELIDRAETAFSNAERKFASVGNSALRLSCAAADIRCDLVRISKELDAALDQPLYTVTSTCQLQSEIALLLDNSGTARQITEEYRQTLFQKTEVAYSCRCTRKLGCYICTSEDSL